MGTVELKLQTTEPTTPTPHLVQHFPNSPMMPIVVGSDLQTVARAHVDFDADFGPAYGITKGVHVRPSTGQVYAPVALWLDSLDLVLARLAAAATPRRMARIRGVAGAGQQHGSVYWNADAERLLASLDPDRGPLAAQLEPALAHPWSPNWQDQSTQDECDAFDAALGGREELAKVTGSGAHHVSAPSCILKNK
ncbi:putative D-xylulose kinase A [Beauveria bassiana D1-5]|uniref:Putative D-xylulose kinase A n=1 Tax=Beauveria bassiana D1-5 TaxID=1245745 RepID=A0A0A2VH22_BEABA|nr:putative D-xylulose kinase A [Beauveria bassiana D1-5]